MSNSKLQQTISRGSRLAAVLLTIGVGAGCQSYNGAMSLPFLEEDSPFATAESRQATASEAQQDQAAAQANPQVAAVPQPAQYPNQWQPPQQGARHTPAAQPNWQPAQPQFAEPSQVPANPQPVAQQPVIAHVNHGPLAAPSRRGVDPLGLYGALPNASKRSSAEPSEGHPDRLRQITFASEGADFDPDINAAGTHLVFASTRHRETADIYLQEIGGTTVTQLTDDPGHDVMPAFSPDGKRVAFASDRSGNWDLYIVTLDGGQTVQLTNDASQEIHPSFSPDGRMLVYSTHSTTSDQWEMVVVDVEQPSKNKRYIGQGLFPTWAPEGNKIAFQKPRKRGSRMFGIWTVDFENDQAVRPTAIAVSANAAAINPSWSPDGRRLAFCTILNPDGYQPQQGQGEQPSRADVWIINADGTGRANLTRSDALNVQPVWAADGAIFFVSDRGGEGTQTVWSMRPDRAIQLANPEPVVAEPASGRSAEVPTAP